MRCSIVMLVDQWGAPTCISLMRFINMTFAAMIAGGSAGSTPPGRNLISQGLLPLICYPLVDIPKTIENHIEKIIGKPSINGPFSIAM